MIVGSKDNQDCKTTYNRIGDHYLALATVLRNKEYNVYFGRVKKLHRILVIMMNS